MKIKYIQIILIFSLTGLGFSNVYPNDLKLVTRLSGYWKFSVGDDMKWIDPNYDDSDWDQIYVPSNWERNGYKEYNGYAWYRKSFDVYSLPEESPIYLELGRIDDVDEVYLNGKKIGSTGSFHPEFETAHSINRRYLIPKGLLKYDQKNVLSVRVYDSWSYGGIVSGNIGLFVDADYALLDIPMFGEWQFRLGNRREWRNPGYDASKWDKIMVPSDWETQGYQDYDGYACYRKVFNMPDHLRNQNKYLALGKIDDIDEVYLNGEFIGSVYDLKNKSNYRWHGNEYTIQRIYYIPEHLIKYGKPNVLTVVVYDGQGQGGIYEGAIGIMSGSNYDRYRSRNIQPPTFWDLLYEWLVD